MSNPNDHTICRSIGHAWDSIPFVPQNGPRPENAQLRLRCTRCGNEREDEVVPGTGEVVSRRYRYVDGYRLGKGEGQSRKEWRRQFLSIAGLIDKRGRVVSR